MMFLQRFKEHVSEKKLITINDHVLMAVSGGVDSMVLCHLIIQLKSEFNLKLSVIHIQHHLRKDAELDAQLVKSFCKKNKLAFFREDIDPLIKQKNQSIEAWARKNRYNLFNKLKEEIRADKIITGHHGDDQIETILLHIADGSGVDGLRGIREQMNNVIRPMLPFSRKEIEAYAVENKIQFREDYTNDDLSHPRNYLRKKVIPNWKQQTPHLISSVQILTENVNETNDVLDFLLNKSIDDYVEFESKERMIIKLDNYKNEPFSFHSFLINYLIGKNDLWRRHDWNNLKQFIQHGETGAVISIHNYKLLKDRNRIIIQTDIQSDENVYSVHVGDELATDHFAFSWTSTKSFHVQSSNHRYETVDAEKLGQNMQLRLWQSSDRFQPLGMKGHKKMSDFLIDSKVDRFQKNNQFVLAEKNEVLWVCGQRISDRVKVTENTSQLAELSFRKVVG